MNRLIKELKSIRGLKIICPNPDCERELLVSRLEVADMYANENPRIAKTIQRYMKRELDDQVEIGGQLKELRTERKQKPLRVKRAAESVNIGKIVEKIVPSFSEFPYRRSDCRALFEPIDYVIFSGLSRNRLTSIEIVDIKTGKATLSRGEREIKVAVESGYIAHEVLPGDVK